MATNEERNSIFFDASGVARPAAEVAADANSAQQAPVDGAAAKPRRQLRVDKKKYPNLAAHFAANRLTEPGGRPVSTPIVVPKDEEGNPVRDLSAGDIAANESAAKAAAEYDEWKKEQASAPSVSVATDENKNQIIVPQRQANIPAPSREGDMPPRDLLTKYLEASQSLLAHHASLAGAAQEEAEAAKKNGEISQAAILHKQLGDHLNAQHAILTEANTAFKQRRPQYGNKMVQVLAKNKTLSDAAEALHHPIMRLLTPDYSGPSVSHSTTLALEDQANRLTPETPREEGKSFSYVDTNTIGRKNGRKQPITPEEMTKIVNGHKRFGGRGIQTFIRAWKGTPRTPKWIRKQQAGVPEQIPGVQPNGESIMRGMGMTGGVEADPRAPKESGGVGEGGTSRVQSISQGSTFPSPESALDSVRDINFSVQGPLLPEQKRSALTPHPTPAPTPPRNRRATKAQAATANPTPPTRTTGEMTAAQKRQEAARKAREAADKVAEAAKNREGSTRIFDRDDTPADLKPDVDSGKSKLVKKVTKSKVKRTQGKPGRPQGK